MSLRRWLAQQIIQNPPAQGGAWESFRFRYDKDGATLTTDEILSVTPDWEYSKFAMLSLKDALQDGASYWISPGGELILVGDGFHEELAKSLREFLLATGIEIDEGEGQPGDPDSPIFPNAHPQEMYGRYKYMFEHGWVRLRGSDGSLQIHSYFENISRLSDYLGEMIDTQQRASSGFVGSNGIRIRVGIVNPDPYLTDTYGEKWTELYYGQFVMVGDIAKATVKKSRGLLNPYRFRSFKPFYRR